MRRALALFALLSAACAETVVLGTECLTASGVCEQSRPLPDSDGVDAGGAPSGDGGEDPPPSSLDGGDEQPPVEPRDSGPPPRDAGLLPIRDAARPPPVPADAGPAAFPMFINPSFELVDGGQEGEIAPIGQNAQSPAESPIAPWYICRNGTFVTSSASYGLPGRMTTVTPRDGNTFITDTFLIPLLAFNANGITQELAQPLQPGKRYAFAVDVYAEFDLVMLRELVLEVQSTEALGCLLGRTVAVSAPIPPGSWQTRCIDFIAPEPLTPLSRPVQNLMIMVSAPGDPLNLTGRLHIDNIRAATPALCDGSVAP
jgi:hypothetical protein